MLKEFTSSVSKSDVSIPYAPIVRCPCVEEGAESVINEQESFSCLKPQQKQVSLTGYYTPKRSLSDRPLSFLFSYDVRSL